MLVQPTDDIKSFFGGHTNSEPPACPGGVPHGGLTPRRSPSNCETLFVGGGIAHVPISVNAPVGLTGGFATGDVSNADAPKSHVLHFSAA